MSQLVNLTDMHISWEGSFTDPFLFSIPKKSPGGKFWKTLRELYILLYEKILGGIYYEKRNENQNGKGDGQTYR